MRLFRLTTFVLSLFVNLELGAATFVGLSTTTTTGHVLPVFEERRRRRALPHFNNKRNGLAQHGSSRLWTGATNHDDNDIDNDDRTMRGGATTPGQKGKRRPVDTAALAKYAASLGIQTSLIYALFLCMDKILAALSWKVPWYVYAVFFYAFHLKTGAFSLLKKTQAPAKDSIKVRPGWTPPGWVFGVMWPLFVFGIRAVTAALVVRAQQGRLATGALLSLEFHLAWGNLWNTVNRVEQRIGASVPCLYGLLISNLYASYQFYRIYPLAGKLLAATSAWLAAAAALETHVWLLNPDPRTGHPEPLYPARDPQKWKTRFWWED